MPMAAAALEGLDREALIRRLVAAECGRMPEIPADENDINARPTAAPRTALRQPSRLPQRGRQTPLKRSRPSDVEHFCIDLGSSERINAGAVVRCICDASGIRSHLIGAIRLDRTRAFFEVKPCAADQVRRAGNRARIDGRLVQVRPVAAGASPNGKSLRPQHRPNR
jgi:ATP-dependent RNA helicase DeaD